MSLEMEPTEQADAAERGERRVPRAVHWSMPVAAAVAASVTVGLLGATRHADPTAIVAAPAVVTAAVSWRAWRRP